MKMLNYENNKYRINDQTVAIISPTNIIGVFTADVRSYLPSGLPRKNWEACPVGGIMTRGGFIFCCDADGNEITDENNE